MAAVRDDRVGMGQVSVGVVGSGAQLREAALLGGGYGQAGIRESETRNNTHNNPHLRLHIKETTREVRRPAPLRASPMPSPTRPLALRRVSLSHPAPVGHCARQGCTRP